MKKNYKVYIEKNLHSTFSAYIKLDFKWNLNKVNEFMTFKSGWRNSKIPFEAVPHNISHVNKFFTSSVARCAVQVNYVFNDWKSITDNDIKSWFGGGHVKSSMYLYLNLYNLNWNTSMELYKKLSKSKNPSDFYPAVRDNKYSIKSFILSGPKFKLESDLEIETELDLEESLEVD